MSYNLTTIIEMLQRTDQIPGENSGVRVDLRRNPLSWRLSLQVTATGSSLNFPLTWQDAPGVLWCCGCFIWGGEVEETNSLWPNHNEIWMYAWECYIAHLHPPTGNLPLKSWAHVPNLDRCLLHLNTKVGIPTVNAFAGSWRMDSCCL